MAKTRRHPGPPPRITGVVPPTYDPGYLDRIFRSIKDYLERVGDSEEGGLPAGYSSANPSTIEAGTAADPGGEGAGWASAGHIHPISTGVPVPVSEGTVLSEGTGAALARATHVHTIPSATMWRTLKYFEYTDFSVAAAVNTLELLPLPDYGVIHGLFVQHETAFGGGGLTGYTVEVGITGDLTKYALPFDTFTVAADTNFYAVDCFGCELASLAGGGPTSIKVTARSVGGNLNAATAGTVFIEVLWSSLL